MKNLVIKKLESLGQRSFSKEELKWSKSDTELGKLIIEMQLNICVKWKGF